MWLSCRRDQDGFLNEVYYRCLACGNIPARTSELMVKKPPITKTRFYVGRGAGWRWRFGAAAIIATLIIATVMQIPVPVRVLATQVSIDPVKDILPYIGLVNFTISKFSLNYTDGRMQLQVSADYASVTTTETAANITTCKILLGKVLVNYKDAQRTLNMGFASLTMTITVRYQELLAKIECTAYMPLWSALIGRLTGSLP
jgi:hypothetical protein